MFYKLFFQILLVLAIIGTFVVTATKPQMHDSVMIFDSAYQIVEQENVKEENPKTTVITQVQQTPVEETRVVEAPIVTTSVNKTEKVKTTTVKQIEPQKTQVVKKFEQKVPEKVVVTQVKQETKPIQKQVVQEVKPVQKQVMQEPKQIQIQQEQSEEVQWNIWRSNLQNQLMKDVKLPILPKGTVFKFSFDVDKYGKVSNVKSWSLTPAYTPYAIQYISPVIRSYQGRSILDFPAGSNRVTTTVNGGWKISETAKYSTANDYNDTEVVKVKN